jgi:hypothetical protein
MALVHRLDTWTRHHTKRFPLGVDLIPSSNASSNAYNAGEWEKAARETALSLSHWTIGVALAGIAVMAALYIRRRYFSRRPVIEPAGIGLHAPDATEAGFSVPVE